MFDQSTPFPINPIKLILDAFSSPLESNFGQLLFDQIYPEMSLPYLMTYCNHDTSSFSSTVLIRQSPLK